MGVIIVSGDIQRVLVIRENIIDDVEDTLMDSVYDCRLLDR